MNLKLKVTRPVKHIHRKASFSFFFIQVSLGILAINEAVDQGDVARTLSFLRSADVGLYGVTPECAEAYHRELTATKNAKLASGKSTLFCDPGMGWRHTSDELFAGQTVRPN